MADKNAKIWRFPRVLAPSVFQIPERTRKKENGAHKIQPQISS